MKKALSLVFILISSVSYADQLCGMLQSKMVAPVCEPGQACPAFRELVYTITPSNGTAVVLDSKDLATLQSIEALDGTNVCVDGNTVDNGRFEVASIKTE